MRVDFLSDVNEIDPENDNVDITVTLDDGRIYTFVVADSE